MKTKKRQMRIDLKTLNEDGTFEGLLSPYNNVDAGGDVVEPGAYTKTLQENGTTVPVLWQHDQKCPIGNLELEDAPDGLHCKGQLLLELPEAKKAYLLLKAKVIKGLSIGYDAIKAQVVDGVRHLKEIRLWEGSVVTFGMNPLAVVTSVKSMESKGDFNEELLDRQLSDAMYQFICALQNALYGLPWSGLTRVEILSAAETVIEQFNAAYMEYLPQYLDYLAREYGLDTKSWSGQRETKEGRKLSSATKGSLSDCHGHIKSAFDILAALLDEEAGDEDESTSNKAAVGQAGSKPDDLHLAAKMLTDMSTLLS